MEMNIDEIEAALRRYEEAVAEILGVWGREQETLGRADARDAVRALKQSVKDEYKRQRRATGLEALVYGPAMHRLHTELQRLSLKTRPGPEWIMVLRSAQDQISYDIEHRVTSFKRALPRN
jgi:hypothetical protein